MQVFIRHKAFKDYWPKDSSFDLDPILSPKEGMVFFDSCEFKSNCRFIGERFPGFCFLSCKVEDLEITNSTLELIALLDSRSFGIEIAEDSIENLLSFVNVMFLKRPLNCSNCYFKRQVNIQYSDFISNSYFSNCDFSGGINIYQTHLASLLAFDGCKFSSPVSIKNTSLPDTLEFTNDNLSEYKGEIDLTNFIPRSNKKCKINLYGTDINKLRIDMSNFELYFPKSATIYDSVFEYGQLLNEMDRNGFKSGEGYKRTDILVKELTATTLFSRYSNFFQKYWWNYGYDKFRIIIWSIILLFIFFILNYSIFRRIIETYPVDNFLTFYGESYRNRRSPNLLQKAINCFMFTCVIFWGLRVKIENFKLSNYLICAYIMLQYIIGIVCLAYIANIIIAR